MQMYKCCCCSLKIGVFIFGITEILKYVIILGLSVNDYNNAIQNYTTIGDSTEYVYESSFLSSPEEIYLWVPLCSVMTTLSSVMIFGSHKNKYKFMMPYFYASIFINVTYIVSFSYDIMVEFGYNKDMESGLLLLARGIIFNLINIYCCFMVFSRIKEIKGSKNIIYPLVM